MLEYDAAKCPFRKMFGLPSNFHTLRTGSAKGTARVNQSVHLNRSNLAFEIPECTELEVAYYQYGKFLLV